MRFTEQIAHYVRRLIASPTGELTRAQRTLRFSLELGWHCAKALKYDRAGEMAAALTYRTIFSLVPMFVMALIVFRAFGGLTDIKSSLQEKVYEYLQIRAIRTPDQPAPATQSGANHTNGKVDESKVKAGELERIIDDKGKTTVGADAPAKTAELSQPSPPVDKPVAPVAQGVPVAPGIPATEIPLAKEEAKDAYVAADKFLSEIEQRVSTLNFQSIGAVGLVLFLWAGIGLAVTLEESFNRIFNCPVGRPWHLRVPLYWAVMTLGPVLVWASTSMAGKLVSHIESVSVFTVLIKWVSGLAALFASWLLLFLLYKLLPNATVRLKPALVGSFIGACLWEIAKWAFNLYVTKALPYSAIYGTLALMPLFLLWLYLTWLIVLFGLEVTYTLQAMRGRNFKYASGGAASAVYADPQWLLPMMVHIGRAFHDGKTLATRDLADRLNLSAYQVSELQGKLADAGMLSRLTLESDGEGRYTPARPLDAIRLDNLLTLADALRIGDAAARQSPAWDVLRKLSDAQRQAVGEQTLATLVEAMVRKETAEAAAAPAPPLQVATRG